jgi:hypothetical protein
MTTLFQTGWGTTGAKFYEEENKNLKIYLTPLKVSNHGFWLLCFLGFAKLFGFLSIAAIRFLSSLESLNYRLSSHCREKNWSVHVTSVRDSWFCVWCFIPFDCSLGLICLICTSSTLAEHKIWNKESDLSYQISKSRALNLATQR